MDGWVEKWRLSKKKLVVIGSQNPKVLSDAMIEWLGNAPEVLVVKEATSNVHHPNFVAAIDPFIDGFAGEDFKRFQPNLVVSIGGMVVSKRWKKLLRSYANEPIEHWHIDPLRAYDTYGFLTQHIPTTPMAFFEKVCTTNHASIANDATTYFIEKKNRQKLLSENYIASIPYSDLWVFDCLSKWLPQNIQLQISNSSAIRYAMLVDLHPSIEIFANRGTSGIDGSTSTAIGAAVATTKPTVLITGDISFFYDSNALWNNYIPKNFKIILLNNSGGGIFRILPGHQPNEIFDRYFETRHSLTAKPLAEMYGFAYFSAKDAKELPTAYSSFIKVEHIPCILEIFTPSETNSEVLKNYFRAMSNKS